MTRKKKILLAVGIPVALLALAVALPHVLYAGKHSPLAWKKYDEGMAEAKASNKPVLLKVYSDY